MPEHTIAENLTRLQNAATAIGNAITAKGGTVASGDGLEDFASDIATIPSGGEQNVEYDETLTAAFTVISYAKSVKVPYGVTEIGGSCFNSWYALRYVEIPSTVTAIASNAFLRCNHVTVYIDKSQDSITGEPWGANSMTVIWND